MIKNVINEILWYRYHDAEEILDGVEDFLRGPDWLIHTDDRAKFEAVRKNRVPTQPMMQLPFQFDYNQYVESLTYPGESKRRRLFRRITLNGWLLPANREVIVRAETPLTYSFYRAKRVLNYSAKNHCGYISNKVQPGSGCLSGFASKTDHQRVLAETLSGRLRYNYR